ncbi:carbohydrate ABC transporter permease [Acidisoma silvae]|uniref:Carbohydrate ABC transporter permease n=1 Tax=Acidisoma silvae TaxID=2802396 RepID=A0A964DZR9_9PROT|nr:carbohydrate ABC transporter permease [Acidisoma silvae]MCB8876765.1 carbohydrate ABC transporter permease [Acidisoma silvae]
MRRHASALGQQALLILLCIVSLYPLWFILQTALKTQQDYTRNPTDLPAPFSLQSFAAVFRAMPFAQWTLNSALVALVSVAAATVIALLAAYAVAFGRFRGQTTFLSLNIALMALPPVALVVPLFTVMVQVGLINTLPSVMLVYTGLLIPFSVFFLTNFLRELPLDVIEAATIDGASHPRILLRIVLPLSLATLFTLIVVNTIWVWNELLFALVFLQNNDGRTVMAGLALFQGRYSVNEPLMMAGAFLSILPLLILYLFSQRAFVRGMTSGIGK